ncbi:hypothetical protein BGZ99_003762 [Dissophora globulifera]|uniref:Uncharacterized protein n=1 Tax=Dissophora globulifera TaxID=979702 RepID=A0A9P6RM24_9FUNG|nr:hypothetical protein BGZ99_003762 [Dissophora globulifera]
MAAEKYFIRMRMDGLRTGDYGNPPQFDRWWKQTFVFSLGLVVMKIVVVIVLTWPFLLTFGEWFLGWTLQNEKLQILFVMLILPLSMNICQYWAIDYILKQKPTEKFPIRIDEDEEDLYGLVGGLEQNYDEDGEDTDGQDLQGEHDHSPHQLSERMELNDDDEADDNDDEHTTPKHADSEFSQFPSASSRRL